MCDYMENCSGHGTCQTNGQCLCDAGWKSADCSMSSRTLTNGYYDLMTKYGPQYLSFASEGGYSKTRTELYSTRPMNVYVSVDSQSNPTEYFYDIALKDVLYAKLDSLNFDMLRDARGYSVSVVIPNMNEVANSYYSSQLLVTYTATAQAEDDNKDVEARIEEIATEFMKSSIAKGASLLDDLFFKD